MTGKKHEEDKSTFLDGGWKGTQQPGGGTKDEGKNRIDWESLKRKQPPIEIRRKKEEENGHSPRIKNKNQRRGNPLDSEGGTRDPQRTGQGTPKTESGRGEKVQA